jgi:hypothetical protein
MRHGSKSSQNQIGTSLSVLEPGPPTGCLARGTLQGQPALPRAFIRGASTDSPNQRSRDEITAAAAAH